MNRKLLAKPFMVFIIVVGSAICLNSFYRLPIAQLDVLFLLLAQVLTLYTTPIVYLALDGFGRKKRAAVPQAVPQAVPAE